MTSQTCPPLASEAVNVQEKFETLVLLFAVCYFKYNSTKPIDDVALDTLGTTHLHSFQTNIQHTQRVNIINSLYFIKFFITFIHSFSIFLCKIPGSNISTKNAHAGRTHCSFYEEMEVSSWLLQRARRRFHRLEICQALNTVPSH